MMFIGLIHKYVYIALMKVCTDCKIEKSLSEYYNNASKKSTESYCKKCSYIRSRRRALAKAEKGDPEYIANARATWIRSGEKISVERKNNQRRERYIYFDCKRDDKKKNRENDLTLEFIKLMIVEPCSYCGDTKSRMSLDRIDNSMGHLQSNVVPSCVRCNITRGQMPYAAWLTIAPAMRSAREAGLFGDWDGDLRRKRV